MSSGNQISIMIAFTMLLLFMTTKHNKDFNPLFKEILERRQGEPIKFLFLYKMDLLGSQVGKKKKMLVLNYEQILRAVFSCLYGQELFFYIVESALKSCLIKK